MTLNKARHATAEKLLVHEVFTVSKSHNVAFVNVGAAPNGVDPIGPKSVPFQTRTAITYFELPPGRLIELPDNPTVNNPLLDVLVANKLPAEEEAYSAI